MIKMSRDEIIEILTELFLKKEDIVLGYLFGSIAENKTHKFSDVDVAIYVKDFQKEKEFDYKLELIGKLNTCLQSDNVDLVIMNNASPTLVHRILHYGIILKCSDEGFRMRYLIRSYKEYEDAQHLLKIQNEYRNKRLMSYVES
ncbi:MAG: nucleotidyltransferase domain-containing protein [Bacteroidota bacterium]|nr:nucleotidyltransferase domain-containing protein [Bacteroidota bacterium]